MSWAIVVAVSLWAWGLGWFGRGSSPFEIVLLVAWPVTLPIGLAYHRYRWGAFSSRFVYTDTRWWQRGEKQMRASGAVTEEHPT